MSFKGEIEARCPNGCEPFKTDIWSCIRVDQDSALRLAVLAREANLLLCPDCNAAFFPSEPYIYFEPQAEILAFVFPEEYQARKEYWRRKMADDFKLFKEGLGRETSLDIEPEIFFGSEDLALLLEGEDYRAEEREVMERIAKDLGLSLYRVSPQYARNNGVPGTLPYLPGKSRQATPQNVIRGLEKLVAANDRLSSYSQYLGSLKSSPERLPPKSKAKSS